MKEFLETKKKFEKPSLEIIMFALDADIITTSSGEDGLLGDPDEGITDLFPKH